MSEAVDALVALNYGPHIAKGLAVTTPISGRAAVRGQNPSSTPSSPTGLAWKVGSGVIGLRRCKPHFARGPLAFFSEQPLARLRQLQQHRADLGLVGPLGGAPSGEDTILLLWDLHR
jgi:hypothetical protein